MKRHGVNKYVDKKVFTALATKTKKLNVKHGHFRGGICL